MFLYSCSDDPTSAGLGLLDGDYITLNADSSIQTQSASFFRTTAHTALSDRVLLGKNGNLKSSMLIQFNLAALPDSIQKALNSRSLSITSAKIEMSPVYTLGSSSAPFDFLLHKVNSVWGQGFTADSLSRLNYEAANVKSGALNITDSLYSFSLDNNSVLGWFLDSNNVRKNYGLYFEPAANSARIVGFQAVAVSPAKPLMKMTVVFTKAGAYQDTLSFTASNDLHFTSGSLPQVNNADLVVQGNLAVSSKFQISTATIPANAIVNNATLELTVDSLNSIIGNPAANYLVVRFVTDPNTNAYDSSRTAILNKSGNIFSGNIAPLIQRWINKEPNYGLIISLGAENSSADLYAFKGSNSADRPRLKILYTAKNR